MLTFPLLVTLALVVPLLVLYLSPLYALTLQSAVASGVAGTVVALIGFVYYWSRFRLDPTPRADSYLVTLSITVVEMIGDAVLGVVLWLGPLVATSWYAAQATGLDPRVDQTLGAGILWIGGDLVGLPFILIVVNRMSREDTRKAAVVDAELDAAGPPGCGGRTTRSSPSGSAGAKRPPATAGWCARARAPAPGRRSGRRTAWWRRRRGSPWWP